MLGGGGVGCMGREEWCCSGVDGKAGRVSGWCTEALCNGLLAGVTCKGGMCLEGGVMPRWQWLILGGWGRMRGVAVGIQRAPAGPRAWGRGGPAGLA